MTGLTKMLQGLGQQIAGEFIFNSHRSGTLYTLTAYLMLEPTDKKTFLPLPIPFPCNITVNGRTRIVITEVDGLNDTVKEDMGFSGYNLTISFEAGDYSVSLPGMEGSGLYLPAHVIVAEVAKIVKDHKGPVKIIEGAGFNLNKGMGILGTLMSAASKASQVLSGQAPLFDIKPSLLNALGINMVVFQSFSVSPVQNRRYQVSLSAVAEMDDLEADGYEKLFPEKKPVEEGG